jgi:RNA polymerase sigma-70 factor, ECF subfamily
MELFHGKIVKMIRNTSDEEMTDLDLVAAFQAGDKSVFNAIVLKHQDLIFGLCCRILDDSHDAEEIAQETFVRAYEGLDKFRSESRLSTWLYRIAVNLCKNRIGSLVNRMKHRILPLMGDGHDQEVHGPGVILGTEKHSPSVLVERKEVQALVSAAIARLPPAHKVVVVLADMEGRSYEEIAEMLGEKIGTVKSRLNRAREILKTDLREVL